MRQQVGRCCPLALALSLAVAVPLSTATKHRDPSEHRHSFPVLRYCCTHPCQCGRARKQRPQVLLAGSAALNITSRALADLQESQRMAPTSHVESSLVPLLTQDDCTQKQTIWFHGPAYAWPALHIWCQRLTLDCTRMVENA
ncbi:hypothetical protein K437DRAFT_257192 [Tilletiaria anomala UBC 951]|uniref:SRCR domain-containing protein n=1 Tax=Tilletiaria anomala (strain ATCC 24038 / CBS 436.72 / UBC 951) TaxID=1037660 RepID=A0A066VZ16_TILAU|nr:uncharacterized protein K437DRAFT_257192 [Tilletiaria anomala UBC 951]KDN44059.1 hypothetical protein K437DRAFT_257192 [Tilletiaria anomala UBC 951]